MRQQIYFIHPTNKKLVEVHTYEIGSTHFVWTLRINGLSFRSDSLDALMSKLLTIEQVRTNHQEYLI